jgi:orotidine-5'-phosphate decarboxylase
MANLVIALDYQDSLEALNLAGALHNQTPCWMKVGLELFVREGPMVVKTIKRMGYSIMLDLKMFDIPNTVRGGVRSAASIGADMLTIHLLGGESMCRAAMEEARALSPAPTVFGITVLTSMGGGRQDLAGQVREMTLELAARAAAWGLDGVVCSGLEVAEVKAACPGLQCLTPGIRPKEGAGDDQRRIVTPAEAVARGADFLVVGRPITRAADPAAAARAIMDEMNGAGSGLDSAGA